MAQKALVGLDIGHRNVRAVFVRPSRDGVRIAGSGSVDLVGEGNGNESINVPTETLQQVLRELWRSSRIASKHVAVGTNQVRTVTRLVTFPRMPLDDLTQVIEMEAARHLPIDARDLLSDFSLTDTDVNGDRIQVVLAGTSRRGVDQILGALTAAGLKPAAFDVSAVAAHRALTHPAFIIEGMDDDEPVRNPEPGTVSVLVDLGYAESRISIFEEHTPVLSRSIPVGGRAMTMALSDARGVEPEAAEQIKRQMGLSRSTSWRSPLFDDLELTLQQLGRQILQSLQFFAGDFRESDIASLYLYGATAAMPGLAEVIADFLAEQGGDSLPWKDEEPVVKCVGDIRTDDESISGVEYLTAAGLALWGVTE